MRKSIKSITIVSRRTVVILGIVLSLTVFGVIAWQASASGNRSGSSPGNVQAGKQDNDSTGAKSGDRELRERIEAISGKQSAPISQDEKQARIDDARAIIRSDYFDVMNAAAQMREERIAGEIKVEGVIKPYDFEAASKGAVRISFAPWAEGLAPLTSSFANPLVNNPTVDVTAQNTQSETSIVLGSGGNVVGAFNDSGAFIGGASHFTGYSVSVNGGGSYGDQGSLPNDAEGDAG